MDLSVDLEIGTQGEHDNLLVYTIGIVFSP